MQFSGKDWSFEVSEHDLVRMAMRVLKQNGSAITLRAVAEMSGLSIQQVKIVVQQDAARRTKEQEHG